VRRVVKFGAEGESGRRWHAIVEGCVCCEGRGGGG
jgi:G3E family GTPase